MSMLADHWRAWRAAIRADNERRRHRPPVHESAFLPARLEVLERPVSPAGRLTAGLMGGLLTLSLAWVVLGRLDVVVTAPGTILPSGHSRIVQSAQMGVVAAIHVHDGDTVRRGQVLVELDTTLANAEVEEARRALLADELDIARDKALVDAITTGHVAFGAPAGTPPEEDAAQRGLIAAQLAEVNATVAGYSAARAAARADTAAAAAAHAKLDASLPILDHEVEAMQRLDAEGYAPGMRLLELQRQRASEAGDRDIAAAQQARGMAEVGKARAAMEEARETLRRQAMTDLAHAAADATIKQQDLVKASRRASLQRLTAPVDGTVQQLQIHTLGGVVEPARTLMVVVPKRDDVEVEARILNRDIGFVREGQKVAVKVDAFPFTHYGTVPGTIVALSHDAVPDPRLGTTYVAQIRLDRATIAINGRQTPLSAGLSVAADVRIGSRRIIWWLLSPVLTTIDQAAHEQ